MTNSFNCQQELNVNGTKYQYFNLTAAEKNGLSGISKLPFTLKILLENLLRFEDNDTVKKEDLTAFVEWLKNKSSKKEIAYRPARVLMQDFTGVPAVVDLAAMRDAVIKLNGNPQKINPLCAVDLVIDHSVQVDEYGTRASFATNVELEMERNNERYTFLKWGQESFDNFRVVPPGTGICHQVNLEYLGEGVWANKGVAYPDTLVGTDSHTTMINGLGVLGWGVGGIEAEAAMLGQPVSMLIPEVVGFRLEGKLREGVTATDLVLTVTQMLRAKGVVGKFVEFYGPGLHELPVADRATIANMAPEYGATCGFFPIDDQTIEYMELTGRKKEVIERVKAYTQAQGLWHDKNSPEPIFTDTLKLNLSDVVPSLAGPKRPQDRVELTKLREATETAIAQREKSQEIDQNFATTENFDLHHGDVVIAAITSCTNTSNPSVMIAAGLVAKKALEKGLKVKPWVKTSLAPGSKVVTEYLNKTDLTKYLDDLGFYLVGYGCTTCIGNSGPLSEAISKTIAEKELVVCSVLSGNRNFEGRIHPLVKASWLASPPLVVAYALAGTTRINLDKEALGKNEKGEAIYLKDIWPTQQEIANLVAKVDSGMFNKEYAQVFDGDAEWKKIPITQSATYSWDKKSTYVQLPPYFDDMPRHPGKIENIENARILSIFGDSITTDHISPASSIKPDSPAGKYLMANGVAIKDFNSYGSRRGNHEVMMRGTFANIRIKNEMTGGVEGGITKYNGKIMPIYDAAMEYKKDNTPLVIFAGKEYGSGSSRDWAAKGPSLLGVKAVVAESYERIHRSNLVGMGILPLEFRKGEDRKSLQLTGDEVISFEGVANMQAGSDITMIIKRKDGSETKTTVHSRIDTNNELEYYRHGGILQYVVRSLI